MTGLVGVVTGAGSGIGRATAKHLLGQGARVAGWDLGRDGLAWMADHPDGLACQVDVTNEAAVAEAAARVREVWGRVDFVVNSAGVFLVGSLADVGAAEIRNLFDINVTGTTLVTQALLPELITAGGAVINLSSTVGVRASVSNAHYAASKAAVAHLTRCWALELAEHGVRVNAVAPGPTETAIFTTAGMDPAAVEQLLTGRADGIPLGRTGNPDEIAIGITRLLTDTSWMSGQVLAIDGGMSLA